MSVLAENQYSNATQIPSPQQQQSQLEFLCNGGTQITSLRVAVSGVVRQLQKRVFTLEEQCAEREALLSKAVSALRQRAAKRRQKGAHGWVSYSRLRSQNAASSVVPPGGLVADQALEKAVAALQFDWQVGCELLRKMRCKWALAALFGACQVAHAQTALAEQALWRQKEPLLRPCFWALWRYVLRRRAKDKSTARPRFAALAFLCNRTLARFLCRWMQQTSRRIALRAVESAAAASLRRRILKRVFGWWRVYSERRLWERGAMEWAGDLSEFSRRRACFRGWRTEAEKRRALMGRLLMPGAQGVGKAAARRGHDNSSGSHLLNHRGARSQVRAGGSIYLPGAGGGTSEVHVRWLATPQGSGEAKSSRGERTTVMGPSNGVGLGNAEDPTRCGTVKEMAATVYHEASPFRPPTAPRHVAPSLRSRLASEGLASPRGPLEPSVSQWAAALLQKIGHSVESRNSQVSAEPTDFEDGKQEDKPVRSAFAAAQGGSLRGSKERDVLKGTEGLLPAMGDFTLEDACEIYHARSLAGRALLAWRDNWECARSGWKLACAFADRSRARRVFCAWLYSSRGKTQTAVMHHRANLIRRVFTRWAKHARQSVLLEGRLEAAVRGRRHQTLSLVLWGWREWNVNKRRRRESIAEAEVAIVRRKTEMAFEGWRCEAARKTRKRRAARMGLAAGLGRVWGTWAGRAKARVLLRRVFATAEARWALCALFPSHHSEFQSVLASFTTWRAFTLQRAAERAEQVRIGAADVYNRARLLTKAFQILRHPVDEHREKQEERLFRRKLLWAWRDWADRKKSGPAARVLERFKAATGGRTVGEYNRARVMCGILRSWAQLTMEKHTRGNVFRAKSLLRRAVAGWGEVWGEKQEQAVSHVRKWALVRLRRAVTGWRELVLRRREWERRVEEGRTKVGRRLKAAGLAAWKVYRESRRQKQAVTLLARQHANLLLKRRTLRAWLRRLSWRDLKERAAQIRARRLKRATWRALIRHTRESQVVRDLVTGSRTRGFSVATSLRGSRAEASPLESGRETPISGGASFRVGKVNLKGGETDRATSRSSWGLGRPGSKTPKSGGETPKSGVGTLRRATSLAAEGAPPSPLGLRVISRFAAPQEGGRRPQESEERASLPTGKSKGGALTKGGQDLASGDENVLQKMVGDEKHLQKMDRDENVLQKMDGDGTEEPGPRGRVAERGVGQENFAGVTANAIQTAGGEGRVGAKSVGRLKSRGRPKERNGSLLTSADAGRHEMTSAETGLKLESAKHGPAERTSEGFLREDLEMGSGLPGSSKSRDGDTAWESVLSGAGQVLAEKSGGTGSNVHATTGNERGYGGSNLSEEASRESLALCSEEAPGGVARIGRKKEVGLEEEGSAGPGYAGGVAAKMSAGDSHTVQYFDKRTEDENGDDKLRKRERKGVVTQERVGAEEGNRTEKADGAGERSERLRESGTGQSEGRRGQRECRPSERTKVEVEKESGGRLSRGQKLEIASKNGTAQKVVRKSTGMFATVSGGKRLRRLSYVERNVPESAAYSQGKHKERSAKLMTGRDSSEGVGKIWAGGDLKAAAKPQALSPLSEGGLSPWGGAESVWSPEGVALTGGFIHIGGQCPPESLTMGKPLAGKNTPPEQNSRTETLIGDVSSAVTPLPCLEKPLPQAEQQARNSAIEAGLGTRGSLRPIEQRSEYGSAGPERTRESTSGTGVCHLGSPSGEPGLGEGEKVGVLRTELTGKQGANKFETKGLRRRDCEGAGAERSGIEGELKESPSGIREAYPTDSADPAEQVEGADVTEPEELGTSRWEGAEVLGEVDGIVVREREPQDRQRGRPGRGHVDARERSEDGAGEDAPLEGFVTEWGRGKDRTLRVEPSTGEGLIRLGDARVLGSLYSIQSERQKGVSQESACSHPEEEQPVVSSADGCELGLRAAQGDVFQESESVSGERNGQPDFYTWNSRKEDPSAVAAGEDRGEAWREGLEKET